VVANIDGIFGAVALAYNRSNRNVYAVTGSYNGSRSVGIVVMISSESNTVVARTTVGFAGSIIYNAASREMYVSNPTGNTIIALATSS
jgi:hypothetical protein